MIRFFFHTSMKQKKKKSSFLIIEYNRQYTPTEIIQTAFIFYLFNIMLEFLKPLPLIFCNMYHITHLRKPRILRYITNKVELVSLACEDAYYHFAEFSTLSFDDVTVDDVTVARDMFTKMMATGIVFQRLKISSSISIFDRHIFNNFVATVIRETNILVIFNVFMTYSALISSQNMMLTMKIIMMAAVHILIFGEMAGFKIVPFIATHVEMEKKKKKIM